MSSTYRFTLDNGLRVVGSHDPKAVMGAFDLLYNVGARREQPGRTGLAHLMEHLMFDGSVNIPDFDDAIEKAGGMNNAWTSNDFTNFYEIMPAVNIETAFWLESDRMLSPAFTEQGLAVQKSVVIEEFKQTTLNEPYGDMGHLLRELVYREHPYRWPVIGLEESHIAEATMTDVKQFFFSHYAPDNAVLAVTGGVAEERVRELAEKWFGPIPARRPVLPALPVEPHMTQGRRLDVTRAVPQAMVCLAWLMPGYGSAEHVDCDILTDILAAGRSSRMYRELVMDGRLFSEADASITGSEDQGMLMMTGKLLSPTPEAILEATKQLLAQADRLMAQAPDPAELQRAVIRNESEATFDRMNVMRMAKDLAWAEMHGETLDTRLEQYRAATPERLQATARQVFSHPHATLVYHPDSTAART